MPFCQRFPNQPLIPVRVPDGDSNTSEEEDEEENEIDKGGEDGDANRLVRKRISSGCHIEPTDSNK